MSCRLPYFPLSDQGVRLEAWPAIHMIPALIRACADIAACYEAETPPLLEIRETAITMIGSNGAETNADKPYCRPSIWPITLAITPSCRGPRFQRSSTATYIATASRVAAVECRVVGIRIERR